MVGLLDLPTELLANIISRLRRSERTIFRVLSHACEDLATPLIYDEIFFDLEPHGCTALIGVANSAKLRGHVHVLHLRRRSGFKVFTNFRAWHNSNIFEYQSRLDENWSYLSLIQSHSMSEHEWKSLDETGQSLLYNQYERDKQDHDAYILRLASAVLLSMSSEGHSNHPSLSDAQRLLRDFQASISLLSNVHTFTHSLPYLHDERWGSTWQKLHFHPEALILYCGHGDDPDIDNLQLFAASRAILLALNSIISMKILMFGRAIWDTTNLLHLFKRKRLDDETNEWTVDVMDPLTLIEPTENISRGLVAMERSFSCLTTFDCRIDTIWLERPNAHETVGRGLARFIAEATRLKDLTVVFGEEGTCDSGRDLVYFDHEFKSNGSHCEKFPMDSMQGSTHILQAVSTIQELRHLHLEMSTGSQHLMSSLAALSQLRHLQFRNMTLLPGCGQWDDVFRWIATHLQLDTVQLESLEDVCEAGPRLLLCPSVPLWEAAAGDDNVYNDYEEAIIRFVLRQSRNLPKLLPNEFLGPSSER